MAREFRTVPRLADNVRPLSPPVALSTAVSSAVLFRSANLPVGEFSRNKNRRLEKEFTIAGEVSLTRRRSGTRTHASQASALSKACCLARRSLGIIAEPGARAPISGKLLKIKPNQGAPHMPSIPRRKSKRFTDLAEPSMNPQVPMSLMSMLLAALGSLRAWGPSQALHL